MHKKDVSAWGFWEGFFLFRGNLAVGASGLPWGGGSRDYLAVGAAGLPWLPAWFAEWPGSVQELPEELLLVLPLW